MSDFSTGDHLDSETGLLQTEFYGADDERPVITEQGLDAKRVQAEGKDE